MKTSRLSAVACLFVSLLSVPAYAQNMQVIGSNSMAQECYRASTSAALTGTAGATD